MLERKRRPNSLLYFAYGANMDVEAMKRRCPASRPLGLGSLREHQFVVSADGYGSVRRKPASVVLGLVWRLAQRDIPALDRYEAVGSGLYRKQTKAVTLRGGLCPAMIYVARPLRDGPPAPGYMEDVLAAATALSLPQRYIDALHGWLPR